VCYILLYPTTCAAHSLYANVYSRSPPLAFQYKTITKFKLLCRSTRHRVSRGIKMMYYTHVGKILDHYVSWLLTSHRLTRLFVGPSTIGFAYQSSDFSLRMRLLIYFGLSSNTASDSARQYYIMKWRIIRLRRMVMKN
jgi:hypothetical protein